MKRSRVNPRSERTITEAEIRRDIRDNGPLWCQIGPVLERLGVPGGCKGRARVQGLHERRKASSGGSKINEANLISACNLCNGILEDAVGEEPGEPRYEIERSELVVREVDPAWESLGRRADRMLDSPS